MQFGSLPHWRKVSPTASQASATKINEYRMTGVPIATTSNQQRFALHADIVPTGQSCLRSQAAFAALSQCGATMTIYGHVLILSRIYRFGSSVGNVAIHRRLLLSTSQPHLFNSLCRMSTVSTKAIVGYTAKITCTRTNKNYS